MKNRITPLVPVVLLAMMSLASATTYYVDPATGAMTNPGTSSQPWSTLTAVFNANKKFVAGDVILCRTGYHGAPNIRNANTGDVIIQPDTGASPTMSNILFNSAAAHWVLNSFDICPENAGAGTYLPGKNLVDIEGPSTFITIENCHIRAVKSITGYAITDWYNNVGSGSGVWVRTTNCTVYNNLMENIGTGVQVYKGGNFTYVGHNTTRNFYEDGSRGLGDDCVWEFNVVENSFVSDSNHDDCFQSWSVDANNVVGNSTVYRNTLRNNLFISRTDPNQPLYAPPQGMGCFDGMFNGWVVENNVVLSQTYHGLSLYGAINCKIINNTVVENPLDPSGGTVRPWVLITDHKAQADGTAWPVANSGNEVRNNITSDGASCSGGVADHNVTIATAALYNSYFAGYSSFNLQLPSTSPAVGAGSTLDAPRTDYAGNLRNAPFDLGAYEYIPPTYQAWTTMQKLTGNNALTTKVFSPDGLSNLYKYAYGLDPRTTYNPSNPFLPYVQISAVGGVNYLTMNFAGGATDVTYHVQATSDPSTAWTTVKTYTGAPAPGIVTVQDSQPSSTFANRYMRVNVTLP